jgi:hypothetical protein
LNNILKKDYIEFVQVIVASGYLQGDLSVILLDVRGRLSESSAKRIFLSKPKTVNVVVSSDAETVSELTKVDEAKPNKEKKINEVKSKKDKSKDAMESKPKKEKKEKKVKNEKNAKDEKKAKRTVIPSAYMCFLSDKRSEIKRLLKEETPDISAKDLNLSVMKKAGEIWKALTDEEKKPYVDKSSSLKTGSLSVDVKEQEQVQEVQVQEHKKIQEVQEQKKIQDVQEHKKIQEQVETKVAVVEDVSVPALDAEVDEDVLIYNASFNVWVHEVSGMYYGEDDIDGEPLGQLKNGKLVPFKKPSSTKKRVSQ